jgi:hypothetical protein
MLPKAEFDDTHAAVAYEKYHCRFKTVKSRNPTSVDAKPSTSASDI